MARNSFTGRRGGPADSAAIGRRLHLFEFGDQQWFPRVLHDAETALFATQYRLASLLPRLWAERISTVLYHDEPAEILDMCSGSGGPMPGIVAELEKRGYNVRVTLTDLYPNPTSTTDLRLVWLAEPLDATDVSPKLGGVRTMFSAFHHFRPDAARAILKNAFDLRRAICIFEAGPDGLLGAAIAVGFPFHVLVLMPFVRPFRWAYLVFTYLVPLMPLILLWDAVVSYLRIYSPEQMHRLTKELQAPEYNWEIGRISVRGIPGGLPYLIGRPSRSS
jgi:hypothetical protein